MASQGEGRLPVGSLDLVDERMAQLKQLFPEACVEGRIDFDRLRATLGDLDAIDTGRERYRLEWAGKVDAIRAIQTQSHGTLRPCPDQSINFDQTGHIFIEGENLEALKLLQKSYWNGIKMIYIDPPYNTGKEFIYPDNYRDSLRDYLRYSGQVSGEGAARSTNRETDGRYHSKWLTMIYPRLFLARNLLREDGVIFISIDDNEVANLRKVCDEIFGEENFVGMWSWYRTATPPNLSHKIKKNLEYIVAYEKQRSIRKYRGIKKTSNSDDPITKPQNTIKELAFPPHSLSISTDEPLFPAGIYGTTRYPNLLLDDLIVENHTNSNQIRFKNKFVWTQQKLNSEIISGTVLRLNPKSLVLSYKKKRYDREIPPSFIDMSADVDTTEEAAKQTSSLMGGQFFDWPKPVSLLKYLIDFMEPDPDDIILDFFAGSCTTAHAVLDLNREDGGARRFIMVQLPEPCDPQSEAAEAGYATIADIGTERIRRVIRRFEQQRREQPNGEDGGAAQDLGFRVFRLSDSNFKIWEAASAPADGQELARQIRLFAQNLKPDRSRQDLLYELLLKEGLPLTAPVERLRIEDATLYVATGGLLLCLEHAVSEALLQGIIGLKPKQVICLDNAFAGNDQLKTNTLLSMKAHAIAFRTV